MKRAKLTMRRMASATRVACDKEGNGNSCKSNGNEVNLRAMVTRAMVTTMVTVKATMWAMVVVMVMVMVTRLAGNEEGKGKGSKGNGDDDEGGGQRGGHQV
jgi:hypothetical protein